MGEFVWLVMTGRDDTYGIRAVFSDQAKAEDYINQLGLPGPDGAWELIRLCLDDPDAEYDYRAWSEFDRASRRYVVRRADEPR